MPRTSLRRSGAVGHVAGLGLAVAIALGILAACGKKAEDRPATATAAATAPLVTGTPQGASGLTVAQLADRIATAWSTVATYREVTTTVVGSTTRPGSPTASPSAGRPDNVETIDEVVLPDRRRRIVRTTDGTVLYELVAVAGKAYARGPRVPGLSATRPDTFAWVAVDPRTFVGTPYERFYADLVAPAAAPYSRLSRQERSRDAVPLGQTTVGGRSCAAYRLADTTQTGERLEITLALGADDLPCSIETRGGGQTTTTTVTYNLPLTIAAPTGATPSTSGS